MKYRRITEDVEAVQWFSDNPGWAVKDRTWGYRLKTRYGLMRIQSGDWIITDSRGKVDLLSSKVFDARYVPVGGWIDVDNELPEQPGHVGPHVMILLDNKYIGSGRFHHGAWIDIACDCDDYSQAKSVSHWQYFPEAPAEATA